MNQGNVSRILSASSLGLLAVMLGGCCRASAQAEARSGSAIQNIGSDTMVNVAQAWAEEYSNVERGTSIEVSGGGSGVGVAALINGTAQIANTSRRLEPEERERARQKNGQEPREFLVGYDGLAIYVHPSNPLTEISMEQLAEIYREQGGAERWSDLGVTIPGARGDEIVRVSRQNNSGTYHYFQEAVVGKKHDFKLGSMDMNGSKDVVELVGKTATAIGYSGLGYATSSVKVLKVSKKGLPPVMPSVATILDKSYPIARPMFMYTPTEPTGAVKRYLDWVVGPRGQKILESTGYVPLVKR